MLAVILLLAVMSFLILRAQGRRNLAERTNEAAITAPEEAEAEENGKYVVYKGEKYCYNENVISILCMGIDTSISEIGRGHYGENGQADPWCWQCWIPRQVNCLL